MSKTDLLRYVRCPYSFWLLDRGEIAFEDTVDEFQRRLLQEGNEFQRLVESRALRVHVETSELPAVLGQDVVLLGAPGFRNEKLKIRGEPDGIDTALGELLPIEIKSHRDVQRTDELELAFYWLLLDPYRTVPTSKPRGFIILRRDGEPEKVEVAIQPQRFEEVRQLLQEVRETRRRGVRARICGCFVCSQLRREEVLRLAWSRKDLTLIFGIGRHYAPALEEMGVSDYEALLSQEPAVVVSGLREQGYFVSAATVERWQRHAQSWTNQAPVYFGDGPFLEGDSFIALDLEYDVEGFIWLLGTCVVRGDRRDYVALWADNASREKENLDKLAALLNLHGELPVVTWSGAAADLPRIRQAAARFGLNALADEVDRRHRDLFQYTTRSLRLPITGLSLKEIAEYHGIPKISTVRDGMDADIIHQQYKRERDPTRKAALRDQLVDYNRDDLDALATVTQEFRTLRTRIGMSVGVC